MVPQKNLLFVWTLSSTNFFNICLNSVEYKKDVFVLHVVQKKDMCYLEYKKRICVLPGVQTIYKKVCTTRSTNFLYILLIHHRVQTIFPCTRESTHLFVLSRVQRNIVCTLTSTNNISLLLGGSHLFVLLGVQQFFCTRRSTNKSHFYPPPPSSPSWKVSDWRIDRYR